MILVVGDVMTDVIVDPSGPLARGTDTPSRIVMRGGGSGANVACWIAHLGGPCRFAGRPGRDDADHHADLLRAYGVDPRLGRDDVLPTGATVALIAADGERSFYTDRGANLTLGAPDLPAALLDGARLLHVSGHTLVAPGPRAAVSSLMRAAQALGIPVSVDAGSAAYLAQVGREAFLGWTRGATLCFANAAEAALLDAGPADYSCRIVTRGAQGAEAWHGTDHAQAAAHRAERPETTGAGDAAVAGYLLAWVSGESVAACLAGSMATAHRAVRIKGGRPPGLTTASRWTEAASQK